MTFRGALITGVLLSATGLGGPPLVKSGVDLVNLDPAIRPQDDLFRYVNGRWLTTVDIPTVVDAADSQRLLAEIPQGGIMLPNRDWLRLKIGVPSRWRDYRDLEIKEGDLFGNVMRGRAFDNQYRMARIAGPLNADEWLVPVQTLNAYYNPALNEITLPASMLQPPVFDAEADDAANYGAIGALMGHELSHALDDRGQAYDARTVPRPWWTAADLAPFRESAQIVAEQYDGYSPLPGLRVNGEFTLTENFADVTGMSLAYRAYLLSLQGRPAPVLDGFTGPQRFFIGWAALWRVKVRDGYLRQWLLTLPYAPYEYRTNGPVSHLPGFYEAFGVTAGDRLFRPPAARVRVW